MCTSKWIDSSQTSMEILNFKNQIPNTALTLTFLTVNWFKCCFDITISRSSNSWIMSVLNHWWENCIIFRNESLQSAIILLLNSSFLSIIRIEIYYICQNGKISISKTSRDRNYFWMHFSKWGDVVLNIDMSACLRMILYW